MPADAAEIVRLAEQASASRAAQHDLSTLAALVGSNSPSGTLMLQRDAEDVAGCVDITIVRRPAIRTFPASYSKVCDTSRPRRRHSAARRAGLGTPALVNIEICSLPPGSLVSQHISEARPASVAHGLRHAGLRHLGRAYVADRYQSILPSDPRGLLVKVVPARVRDLRVDRTYSASIVGTLRDCQRGLVAPEMLECRDGGAIAESGEILQPEVDANDLCARQQVISDLALEGNIPAAAGVLKEGARAVFPVNVARLPEMERSLEVRSGVARDAHGAWNEWNPAERTLSAVAGPEPWAHAMLITRGNEPATDLANSIRVDAEQAAGACGKLDQFKSCRPATMTALCLKRRRHAEIPYLVHRSRVPGKRPVTIAKSVFEREYGHRDIILRSRLIHKQHDHEVG